MAIKGEKFNDKKSLKKVLWCETIPYARKRHREIEIEQGKVNIDCSQQGVGKTHRNIHIINESSRKILVVAPNHELIEEEYLQYLERDFIHLMGFDYAFKKGMCLNEQLVEELTEKEVPPSYICLACDKDCKYREMKEEAKKAEVVLTVYHMLPYISGDFDLIIADEGLMGGKWVSEPDFSWFNYIIDSRPVYEELDRKFGLWNWISEIGKWYTLIKEPRGKPRLLDQPSTGLAKAISELRALLTEKESGWFKWFVVEKIKNSNYTQLIIELLRGIEAAHELVEFAKFKLIYPDRNKIFVPYTNHLFEKWTGSNTTLITQAGFIPEVFELYIERWNEDLKRLRLYQDYFEELYLRNEIKKQDLNIFAIKLKQKQYKIYAMNNINPKTGERGYYPKASLEMNGKQLIYHIRREIDEIVKEEGVKREEALVISFKGFKEIFSPPYEFISYGRETGQNVAIRKGIKLIFIVGTFQQKLSDYIKEVEKIQPYKKLKFEDIEFGGFNTIIKPKEVSLIQMQRREFRVLEAIERARLGQSSVRDVYVWALVRNPHNGFDEIEQRYTVYWKPVPEFDIYRSIGGFKSRKMWLDKSEMSPTARLFTQNILGCEEK